MPVGFIVQRAGTYFKCEVIYRNHFGGKNTFFFALKPTFVAMYKLVKPLLFSLDPEEAHHLVSGGLRSFCKLWGGKRLLNTAYTYRHPKLERSVFGLTFKNPVGLAAGFDKNAAF